MKIDSITPITYQIEYPKTNISHTPTRDEFIGAFEDSLKDVSKELDKFNGNITLQTNYPLLYKSTMSLAVNANVYLSLKDNPEESQVLFDTIHKELKEIVPYIRTLDKTDPFIKSISIAISNLNIITDTISKIPIIDIKV